MTKQYFLEAALRYAEMGYPVFPCVPGGKAPMTPHGFQNATTDAAQIEAWWAKHPDANIEALALLRSECAPAFETDGFLTHANHNNLSFMPGFLGKERAVRHVIERHLGPEPLVTLGIGDSFSDAPFMGLCDYTLVPRESQLASLLSGRTR